MAELDELSSEELFNSALNDDPPEVIEQITESEGDTRVRDEQGRFAKSEEVEPKPEPEQAKPAEAKEAVESQGVRQLREAFERSERRRMEMEQQLIALRPKPEPAARPDMFEKPDEFVRMNVQEAVSPLEQRLATTTEHWSRTFAIGKHGEERLTQAYSALDQAAKSGDPQAMAVVQAVKQSMDPFGDIVNWYAKNEVSLDPKAFFQKQLEEAMKDEKFKGELLTKLQPAPEEKPGSVIKLPPSIGRVAAARSASDEVGDMSDASLFQHAMR